MQAASDELASIPTRGGVRPSRWQAASMSDPRRVRAQAEERVERPETVEQADRFDRVVAVAAVAEALRRHAGTLEQLPLRRDTWVQSGKDLRRADLVIGSGGVFAARADALELLDCAMQEAAVRADRLVPERARLAVDRDYVLFAVGLLAPRHPEAARALALRSLAGAN
jgi:hypothetical protein